MGFWSGANDQDEDQLVRFKGLLLAPGSRVVVDACSGCAWVAKQGMHKGAEEDRTVVEIDKHPTSLRC